MPDGKVHDFDFHASHFSFSESISDALAVTAPLNDDQNADETASGFQIDCGIRCASMFVVRRCSRSHPECSATAHRTASLVLCALNRLRSAK